MASWSANSQACNHPLEDNHVMNNSKSNLEVKGSMTTKAADRVGYMLGVAAIIAAILLGTAAIIAAL